MVIDTNTVSIALACFLILLTTVVYFVFTAKKSATTTKTKEPAVFITGPSKSGKTALFTLVCLIIYMREPLVIIYSSV